MVKVCTKISNEGQISETHCGGSTLHETKSSGKGQILEASRSPLHKTKTSDKGPISKIHHGQSLLCETKSSYKGQILEAHCG